MPIAEITSGLASLKTLKDLLHSAKEVQDASKFSGIIIEAQDAIISLQDSLMDAQNKIDSITKEKRIAEEELAKKANWEDVESRYKLSEIRNGLYAYRFLPGAGDDTTPEHWACPKCFAEKNLQLLQKTSSSSDFRKCFTCDFDVNFGSSSVHAQTVPRSVNWTDGL